MKKVLTKSFATLFIFLSTGLFTSMYADEWTEKVVADKKFEINKNATLVIDHEFGDVKCRNWNKNEISVKAIVRAKTSDAQKAEKIINKVSVEVKGNKDKVVVECDLNQKNSGNKNINVNIDLEIFMPSTVSLEFDHSFGSAYIESVSGQANISCEYGSIEIASLSNAENKLEIMFSEANVNEINDGKLEVSYSQLDIKTSNNLSVESEYSDISFDKMKSARFELEGGNVAIGQIDELKLETSFTNVDVLNNSESIRAELEYGVLNVKNVGKDFSLIDIENLFGAVEINFPIDASYSFKVNGEFCTFDFPEELASIQYKSDSNFSTSVAGYIGKVANPKSTIKVESKYGTVNFTAK